MGPERRDPFAAAIQGGPGLERPVLALGCRQSRNAFPSNPPHPKPSAAGEKLCLRSRLASPRRSQRLYMTSSPPIGPMRHIRPIPFLPSFEKFPLPYFVFSFTLWVNDFLTNTQTCGTLFQE